MRVANQVFIASMILLASCQTKKSSRSGLSHGSRVGDPGHYIVEEFAQDGRKQIKIIGSLGKDADFMRYNVCNKENVCQKGETPSGAVFLTKFPVGPGTVVVSECKRPIEERDESCEVKVRFSYTISP